MPEVLMPIELLTLKNLAAFRRFSEAAWDRPKSEAYYRWRYFDAPGLITVMANQGDQCVASISAFSRTYCNGDETAECLEPFDWYCLPATRGSGVGVRLLKTLMDTGRPLLTLGGSAETLRIIPRLGWKTVGEATEFFLPLTGNYLLRNRALPDYWKRVLTPSLDLATATWFTPARPNGVRNCVVLPVSGMDHDLARIDGPAGFRSVPDPRFFEWLMKGSPATGSYLLIVLTVDGEAAAWITGRLHRSRGLLHGTVLDLRLKRNDEKLAKNAIRHMARALAGFGADEVRAVATADFYSSVYRKSGFLAAREKIPVLVWAGRHRLSTDHIYLTGTADGAIFPLQDSLQYRETRREPLQQTRRLCSRANITASPGRDFLD